MANQEHLDILKQGVEMWNQWMQKKLEGYPNLTSASRNEIHLFGARPGLADFHRANLARATLDHINLNATDLSAASLSGVSLHSASLVEANLFDTDLRFADLRNADLFGANLIHADLTRANLKGADLTRAELSGADLTNAHLEASILRAIDFTSADLTDADLTDADLSYATFNSANLSGANLSGANLSNCIFVRTNACKATFDGCRVYGISVWNIRLEGAKQTNIIITDSDEPVITVDNLKLAQFIYLLLNNAEIREVIDTITSKVVLILGRFTPERKPLLDALREELRKHNYSPVLFDFDKPASRDLTETVSTLAHLARFIIVDLTDPSSAPHEIATVIPQTVVPVQPVILGGEREYSMLRDLRQRYHWVLPTYSYANQTHLLAALKEHVIAPAEQKAQELEKR